MPEQDLSILNKKRIMGDVIPGVGEKNQYGDHVRCSWVPGHTHVLIGAQEIQNEAGKRFVANTRVVLDKRKLAEYISWLQRAYNEVEG